MAEQREDSKNKKKDLKDIGAIEHEIRDPKIKRSYSSLSLRKDGSLLAVDVENKEVCIFNKNGKLLQSFEVTFTEETGVVELSDGNIAVSDLSDRLIKVYTPHGELVKEFGSDELGSPLGLAVNNKGQLFVLDHVNPDNAVFVYSEDGEFQYSFGSIGSDLGELDYPASLCIGQDGLVYVGDSEYEFILVFKQDGQFIQQLGEGVLKKPVGIATTEDGHIVVTSDDKLFIFTPSGECVHEVKDVGLSNPCGVVVDKNGFIFVADYGNGRIVMF